MMMKLTMVKSIDEGRLKENSIDKRGKAFMYFFIYCLPNLWAQLSKMVLIGKFLVS